MELGIPRLRRTTRPRHRRRRRTCFETLEDRRLLTGAFEKVTDAYDAYPSSQECENPAVAVAPNGDSIVVFEYARDSSIDDIRFVRYDAAGNRLYSGAVTNNANADEESPDVAVDAYGNFVVVWQKQSNNIFREVYFQRYAANGQKLGSSVLVNTPDSNFQGNPKVAMADDGRFVVVWEDYYSSGDYDIKFRRYDANGLSRSGVSVVTESYDNEMDSDVAMHRLTGDFVVIWRRGDNIEFRSFSDTGSLIQDRTQVNTSPLQFTAYQQLAMDDDGDFMVVWHNPGAGGSRDVYARIFSSSGVPRGSQITVAGTTETERNPGVAGGADMFAVAWWEMTTNQWLDRYPAGMVRVYSDQGANLGDDVFARSSFTPEDEQVTGNARVGMNRDGTVVATFARPDSANNSVWAQVFEVVLDTTPPTPNPSGWDTYGQEWRDGPVPASATSVRMKALGAVDASGAVQYYFDEISGNDGGTDSGWQTSPTYVDTGLKPGTTYQYRVRTRDRHGNEGSWSAAMAVTTPHEWYVCLAESCNGPYSLTAAVDLYNRNRGTYTGYYNAVTGETAGRGADSAEQSQMAPPTWYLWYQGTEYGPFGLDLAVQYYTQYAVDGYRNSATGACGGAGCVPEPWHLILGDGNENGQVDAGPYAYDTVLDLYYGHQADVKGWYNDSTGACDGQGCGQQRPFGEGENEGLQRPPAAPSRWHNPLMAIDVNRDGIFSPADALIVINELNARAYSDPYTGQLREDTPGGSRFLVDVNGDGLATPFDALLVMNRLNASGANNPPVVRPAPPLTALPWDPPLPAIDGLAWEFPRSQWPPDDNANESSMHNTVSTVSTGLPAMDRGTPADILPELSVAKVTDPSLDDLLDEIAPDIVTAWDAGLASLVE